MKQLLIIGAAALIASAAAGCKTDNSGVNQPDNAWQLVWEEDFDSTAVDTAVWSKIPLGKPDWCNTMSSYDSLFAVRDGNLVLRGMVNEPAVTGDSTEYITGGIFTKGKKAFDNGRLEICARLQGARGAWPAIWLLPDAKFAAEGVNTSWPHGGEIDIMERLSYDTIAYQTVHSNYTYNLGREEHPKHGSTGQIRPDDYNVYAVEMGPDSLRFFINDVHTLTYPRVDSLAVYNQYPYDVPMYLLIDMQLGGKWVGEVDPADLPVEMHVDWVRFYKRSADK